MESNSRIQEIRARLEAATPRPWTTEKSDSSQTGSVHYAVKTAYKPAAHDWSPRFIVFMCGGLGDFLPNRPMNDYRSDPQLEADVSFIAAAPDDIAYLLAEVERLQGEQDATAQGIALLAIEDFDDDSQG